MNKSARNFQREKLKKILGGIIAITVVLLCLVGCGKPSVTIVNDTGYTVLSVYVSHDSSDEWEEDVLGKNTLDEGETFYVSLPRGGRWDIRLVDEDGDTYTKYGVKTNSRTVFTLDDMD